MVSTRGVKFKFSEGERVLCYEPDPTKAKVLYESKVLDLVVSRDSRGRKVPEYLIHFLGWNSSWDRCVSEEFILPYTEENRDLQTRLAKDAAVTLKGKRKGKVPPLIKETSGKKSCFDSDQEQFAEGNSLDTTSSESESSEDEMEKEIEIKIPDVLKQMLEEDWRCVTQKDMYIKLPCETNVIAILEAFVKHSAANLLCATPPKNGKNGKQLMPKDVENKLNLCREAMDGIRVYFDFTLPHLLLYRQEKKQYYTVGTTCTPSGQVKSETMKTENNVTKTEMEICSVDTPDSNSLKAAIVPKSEPDPPVQNRNRPSLRSHPSQQNPSANVHPVNGNTSKIRNRPQINKNIAPQKATRPVSTRILRSSDRQKTTDSPGVATSPVSTTLPQGETEVASPTRPETPPSAHSPTRQTRKSTLNASPSRTANAPPTKMQPTENPILNGPSSSQLNPPTLSVTSNCVSSSESSTHSSLSSPFVDGQQYHLINNSGLLQEVQSWHMLPPYLYEQVPAAPSLIYGVQHLIRLFVKLPHLISKMNISQKKLVPLLNILHNFLSYLADQNEKLFHPSAYINSSEVFHDASFEAVK